MQEKLKFIACVLVLILTLPLIFACNSPDNDTGATTQTQNEPVDGRPDYEDAADEDPFARFHDSLGEHDFNGEDFKIQTFENQNVNNRIDTEELTGDLINDALYNRNRQIEERFNVNITEILIQDFQSSQTRSVLLAGDYDAFDLFIERCPDGLTNWQQGLVLSYDDIPHIDLSKPYWNQSANKTLTLGWNQYVAIGDASFSTYEIAHAILFNKEMIKDFNLEDPYTLVREGRWTFDKMEELMKPVIHDLNGDGVMDRNDRFGYAAHPKQVLPSFWIAANVFSVGKDENDIPYLSMANERFFDAFNRTFEILWDSGAYFMGGGGADVPQWAMDMFSNNQALFIDTTFFAIERMRNMEIDFGILPYPKLNQVQENYVSRIEYYYTTQVSIINPNPERAGIMLEALNSYSAKTIIPAFYEVALKTKHARDDDSAEMLDLILDTLVIDIGDTTLCDRIRDGFMASMFENNNRNLMSRIESTERIIQRFVDSIPVG